MKRNEKNNSRNYTYYIGKYITLGLLGLGAFGAFGGVVSVVSIMLIMVGVLGRVMAPEAYEKT